MEILQCGPMKENFLFHLNVYWFVHLKTCYIWMTRERYQVGNTECKQNIPVLFKHNTDTSMVMTWLTAKDSYRAIVSARVRENLVLPFKREYPEGFPRFCSHLLVPKSMLSPILYFFVLIPICFARALDI